MFDEYWKRHTIIVNLGHLKRHLNFFSKRKYKNHIKNDKNELKKLFNPTT